MDWEIPMERFVKKRKSILLDKSHFSMEEIREAVVKVIDVDMKAVDLKFALYKAACDKTLPKNHLVPCPPIYPGTNPVEIGKKLLDLNESLPGLPFLRHYLRYPYKFEISREVFELVVWLVLDLQEPEIRSVDPQYHNKVINLVGPNNSFKSPSIIFQVVFPKRSFSELNWQKKSFQKWTGYGFYPCNIEDLHFMIYNGTIALPNREYYGKTKRNMFYTNLNYCLNQTPKSWSWGKSLIGTSVKAICIVEFIDHPSFCKKLCISKKIKLESGSKFIELKNYIFEQPEHARIKYILLYVFSPEENQQKSQTQEAQNAFTTMFTLVAALLAGCTMWRILR